MCKCHSRCVRLCASARFAANGHQASRARLQPSALPTAPRPRVSHMEGREWREGSSSKAVSRAQPAGAAACITTTGFYLVQGGRGARREGRGGEVSGWSRGRTGRKRGKPRYFFAHRYVERMEKRNLYSVSLFLRCQKQDSFYFAALSIYMRLSQYFQMQ